MRLPHQSPSVLGTCYSSRMAAAQKGVGGGILSTLVTEMQNLQSSEALGFWWVINIMNLKSNVSIIHFIKFSPEKKYPWRHSVAPHPTSHSPPASFIVSGISTALDRLLSRHYPDPFLAQLPDSFLPCVPPCTAQPSGYLFIVQRLWLPCVHKIIQNFIHIKNVFWVHLKMSSTGELWFLIAQGYWNRLSHRKPEAKNETSLFCLLVGFNYKDPYSSLIFIFPLTRRLGWSQMFACKENASLLLAESGPTERYQQQQT